MERTELERTHPLHVAWRERWILLQAAYLGARALVASGLVSRHERESERNFRRRIREIYDLNYSKAVVDLFNHYLFRKPCRRELGSLGEDALWQLFRDDCDLWGTDFEVFLVELQRLAAIFGHVGVLVDKPVTSAATRADELERGLYPYLVPYTPLSILDWSYGRDAVGRPQLDYLKLDDGDGEYRIWRLDRWERWRAPQGGRAEPELLGQGNNPLGAIPFVPVYNLRSLEARGLGHSDIADIADIDLSIVRNLSQCEEVIGLAGFPMMRKPMREAYQTGPDLAGVSAVLEFNPEHGEAGKPDWLKAEVRDTVEAIRSWIGFKVQEIYRAANSGGQSMTEAGTQAQSGVALKTRFQLLNSKLAAKGANLAEAERALIWYWLRWQGQERLYAEVRIERPKSYEVDDLSSDLANALTVRELVPSPRFRTELAKRMAAPFLEHLEDRQVNEVLRDIESSVTAEARAAEACPAAAETERGRESVSVR